MSGCSLARPRRQLTQRLSRGPARLPALPGRRWVRASAVVLSDVVHLPLLCLCQRDASLAFSCRVLTGRPTAKRRKQLARGDTGRERQWTTIGMRPPLQFE